MQAGLSNTDAAGPSDAGDPLPPGQVRAAAAVSSTSPSSPSADRKGKREFWKLIPGFAISAFFLWKTVRSIHYRDLKALHVAHVGWAVALAVFLATGYLLRIYRWWFLLRRSGAPKYSVCARVLLTSLAANNVLPFRIGDFLRVFSYAGDLGASSSTILSTVILERLLDVFTLLAFLVALLVGAPHALPPLPVRGHALDVLHFAEPVLLACALVLGLLLFGARLLQRVVDALVRRLPEGPRTEKLQRWALLLFDAVLKLSFGGRLLLLVSSVAVWFAEGMIFVSAARMLDIVTGGRGPWLAVTLSNLSFLLPSSPGAIGTYEFFAKFAMTSEGAPANIAALYGLLVHVIVFFAVTVAGGVAFLVHRMERGAASRPLREDLADLPSEMPADLPPGIS